MRRSHWIYLVLAVLVCTQAGAAATEGETTYYAVFADGKKIGHGTRTRRVTKDKVISTETMEITLLRAGTPMTMRTSETYIETPEGRPLGFESSQTLGAVVKITKGTVTPDGKVQVTISAFNRQSAQTLDWPEGSLMSEGFRLLALEKGLKEGTTYSAKLFVGAMLKALRARVTIGAARKVDLLGRVLTLTEVVTAFQNPMGPGEITQTNYLDKELVPQKSIMPTMGMTLEVVACEKAFALSKNDVVDFLDKTVLKSPIPLRGLASAKSATYTLRPAGEKKIGRIIATDSQTVRPGADGEVIVTVRPVEAPRGVKFPYKGDDKAALAALKPTQYLQSDRSEVINLAKRAVGRAKDAAEAARRIETYVGSYVKTKNLSVGYATAAEVAASKEGDCSEHAVLAAAMCRAVGIPARIVFGYTYALKFGKYTDVFIGHAWVEAYIGGKWVYVDPTQGGAGPGHIAQAVGDGDPMDFFGLINTFGTFKIAKVTVEK